MKIFLFLLITLQAIGQNTKGGIYLTFDDYLNNRLSYKINCKTDKETLKENESINEPYIKILKGKQKIKLYKDSIYAFKPCSGSLIRFQDNKQYHFAEKGALWIYYVERPETNEPEFKAENPYQYSVVKEYYFSVCGDEKIVSLTIENVKKAFSANHNLQTMIDTQFKNAAISGYDTIHKIFKINKELESMKQEKHTELDVLNETDVFNH